MRDALAAWPASAAYLFCDWRQWNTLYDIVESAGYGVRGMIVWDKGTPGMGSGWRCQHELVQHSSKIAGAFDPHRAHGNVLSFPRSGNNHHLTEKPVDLLRTILRTHHHALTWADPFAGSGSTILACELEDRTCCACELMPAYADVAIARWIELTGQTATRQADGKPWEPSV
jgi:DNA modification methylase